MTYLASSRVLQIYQRDLTSNEKPNVSCNFRTQKQQKSNLKCKNYISLLRLDVIGGEDT